jgi:hypothetical protein
MEYILEKGRFNLSFGWPGNTIAKRGCMTVETAEAASEATLISSVSQLAMKLCGCLSKDTKHIVTEGDGHWSDETTRTCIPISCSIAAGQQEQ